MPIGCGGERLLQVKWNTLEATPIYRCVPLGYVQNGGTYYRWQGGTDDTAQSIPSGYKYIQPSWVNTGLRVYNSGRSKGTAAIENFVTLHYNPGSPKIPLCGYLNGGSTFSTSYGEYTNYVFYPYVYFNDALSYLFNIGYNLTYSAGGKLTTYFDNSPYNSLNVFASCRAFSWFLIIVYNGTLVFSSKPIKYKIKCWLGSGQGYHIASQQAIVNLLQDSGSFKIYMVKSKLEDPIILDEDSSGQGGIRQIQSIDMAGLNVGMASGVYFGVLSFGMEVWPYERKVT